MTGNAENEVREEDAVVALAKLLYRMELRQQVAAAAAEMLIRSAEQLSGELKPRLWVKWADTVHRNLEQLVDEHVEENFEKCRAKAQDIIRGNVAATRPDAARSSPGEQSATTPATALTPEERMQRELKASMDELNDLANAEMVPYPPELLP